nr:LysE family translocator [Nitrincola sp. A-D6]
MATSALAFTLIKYIGAAYLIYLGISLLFKQGSQTIKRLPGQLISQTVPLHRVFLQGFMTNALNPKVALFFLAFVPQFIAPEADNKVLAFLLLGCIFNLNGTLWSHVLVFTTAFARQRIRIGCRVSTALNKLIGVLFVGFGLRLGFSAP